ncbi:MAG TPA: trehalose-6-phosphate synthase [Gemmataceae bacterium]
MWTKHSLHDMIQNNLRDHDLIVVANREPYHHRYANGRIECVPPASGMVSALDPLVRACGGVWVAHGSGSADRKTVDAHDCIRVPPEDPSYTLRRVWLTKKQEDYYYYGLSNGGLWPLCHNVFTRPEFDPHHWEVYREVNELFAEAVLEEAGDAAAFVFVQDYHFALLPRILKERNPKLIVAQFWHIPWPNPEVFQVFPWKEELLEGLLGNDLLGFHLRYHCQHFLDTVDQTFEAKVDYEGFNVTRGGKTTAVRPFPIGIDYEQHASAAASPAVDDARLRWRRHLGLNGGVLGVGIDRIDYTKGIPERLRALDRFLENHADYRERMTFVQIGVPSRVHIHQYQQLGDEINALVETINWKWSTDTWRPIVFLKEQHGSVDMMALHQLADFCIVSSLDDGMNLVAKEFVASRIDEDGVLILSRFTGAARELSQALLVNPFAVDEVADAVHQALTMAPEERRRRMQKMRAVVADNNIYRWAGKFVSALLKFDASENGYAAKELVLQ